MNHLAHILAVTDLWIDMYFVHFGAWVSMAFAATLWKTGIPDPKKLPGLFKSAAILSAFLSLFSSHSHAHLMAFLKG